MRRRTARPAIPIAAVLVLAATTACGPRVHRAADPAVPPVPPISGSPASTGSPARPSTPATPISAPPRAASPAVALTGPGLYLRISHPTSAAVYVLRPGASKWTLVREGPSTEIPPDLQGYTFAPSGLLAAGWDEHRLSVGPAYGPTGRVIATAPDKANLCQARWNAASTKLLYATSSTDYRHATLYTINANGTGRHALTGAADPGLCAATWSPNGATIAYVKQYAEHLPIAEYHEAIVMHGAGRHEVHLRLSDQVHLDSVLAIAPDGRHAVVGTKTVQADGGCGDGGPDGWALVDFATGSAYPITPHGKGYLPSGIPFLFDTAGHLIVAVQTQSSTGAATESLKLLDYRGRHLRTLPTISTADAPGVALLAAVA